jgi:acyl-CoA synthetase (AMP-forming)/AMP-acid ligase II
MNLNSSGVPIPNTHVKVINTDTGVNLGSCVVGELCVMGPQVRTRENTKQRFPDFFHVKNAKT